MKVNVLKLDNSKSSTIELSDDVFGCEVRKDILARVVHWQLAKRQAGTHKTMHRGEVSGSTKKLGNQKGGGRARHGSIKAPIFIGGGIAFGPVVRSHAYSLPKKVRKLGLKVALSTKLKEGNLLVVEDMNFAAPKTADFANVMNSFGVQSALIIDGETVNQNALLASSNLHKFDVLPQIGANVYDIMKREKLILTRSAVEALEARLR